MRFVFVLYLFALASTAQAASTNLPIVFTVGTANNFIVAMTEDAWQGDAQYSLSLDGTIVSNGTVTALHGTTPQQVSLVVPNGTHVVSVTFTNDSYGGSIDTDRNLYIEWASYNGVVIPNSSMPLFRNGDTLSETIPPGAAPIPISISVNPSSIMIDDKTTVGKTLATATVKMSDGSSSFGGVLVVSGVNFVSVSGMNLVLSRALTSIDDGNYVAKVGTP